MRPTEVKFSLQCTTVPHSVARREYRVVAHAAGVLIRRGDHVLAVRRRDSVRWGLPVGGVEPGEGEAEAATRELREETGFIVRPEDLVEVLREIDVTGALVVTFEAPDPGGEPTPGEGEAPCGFVPWHVVTSSPTAAFPAYNSMLRDRVLGCS